MLEISFVVSFFIGGLAHLFGTLLEDSVKLGKRVTIQYFINSHPWQLSLSITLSVAAYMMFYKMGELNIVSAFAAGYIGDSIVKKAMGKYKK